MPVTEPAPSQPQAAPGELPPDIQEKLRQADEVLKERRDQADATERLRQELEREKEAAARDREAAQRDRETAARERDLVDRDKEAIERDRLALARDREAARRERELRGASKRAADGADKPASAPKPDTAVWDLPEPGGRSDLFGSASSRKPAPPADKPSTAGPGAKARPRDGGFLSAKDLAAAFKLNHQMALAARELKGQGDDTSDKGDDAPSRYKPSVPGSRRGSRRTGRKLFVGVLVLAAWAVAIVWMVPSWHARVTAFWSKLSHGSNAATPFIPLVPPPEKIEEPPAAPDSSPEGLAPTTIPSNPPPATLPASPQTAPAIVIPPTPAPTPAPTTAPAIIVAPRQPRPEPPASIPAPSPAPAPIPSPSPTPAPIRTPPPAVPATAPAPPFPF